MKNLFNRLFGHDNPIRLILFNIITCTIASLGLPLLIIMIVMGYGAKQIPSMLSIIAVVIVCIFIANRYNKLNLAAGIIVSAVTFVLLPMMFLSGGAIYSGMPVYFSLGTIFLFMLVEGTLFYVLLGIQIVVYALSFAFAFYHPDKVIPLGEEIDIYMDMFLAVVIVGIVCGIINKFTTGSYNRIITRAEEQNIALQESEKRAEQASAAKSDFLSNMSHEIRTPINAIIGMNEMIRRESDNKDISEYAIAVSNSANALLSIINDILDFSKIESGKMEIIYAKYDLFSLINDSYCMIQDRAKEKGLELSIECDENLPAYLNGDITRNRQIIVNLLTNAVKYTEKGSVKIRVSGDLVEFKTGDTLNLKVTVTDTGKGMKIDDQEKLFTKFQRLNLEDNQGIEGTGLGLSIVRMLCNLMNGDVSVESEYGVGSSFTVVLPQVIEDDAKVGKLKFGIGQGAKAETKYEPSFVNENATVLVVDDVKMNLIVFKKLIKNTKVNVDTAISGAECLEMIKDKKYDLIFMDHMMPEMNGIEAYRLMQEDKRHMNVDTPVIMLTANAIAGMEQEYLDKGFKGYLSKPIDPGKLETMIREYVKSE